MPQILVVCTANICRSPVGEALIREKISTLGRDGWTVSSAGTWALVARPASTYSAECLAARGLDISGHIARSIDGELLAQADLVLCMELGHQEALQIEFPQFRDKIFTLSDMIGERKSIRDPYGRARADYERMVAQLAEIIDKGWPRIEELAREGAQKRAREG